MILWLKVSADRLELPEIVADSASELARITGASVNTIYSAVSHLKSGRIKKSIYCRVDTDDKGGEK